MAEPDIEKLSDSELARSILERIEKLEQREDTFSILNLHAIADLAHPEEDSCAVLDCRTKDPEFFERYPVSADSQSRNIGARTIPFKEPSHS